MFIVWINVYVFLANDIAVAVLEKVLDTSSELVAPLSKVRTRQNQLTQNCSFLKIMIVVLQRESKT